MSATKLLSTDVFCPDWARPLYRPLQGPLEACLGLDRINALYERCQGGSPEEFSGKVLEALDLEWDFPEREVARLREHQGPLIVAANHPFGGPEALLTLLLLSRIRKDYRILANYLLNAVPEVGPRLLLVDPFATKTSKSFNRAPLRASLDWLKRGGLVGIFPAGEVSAWSRPSGRVEDGPWSPSVARLALKSGAAVLPLHFEGHNGTLFQAAGMLSPSLRTLLLPRTLLKPAVRRLRFKFGSPIPAERLRSLPDPQGAAAYLRGRCYLLREDGAAVKAVPERAAALAEAVEPGLLREETDFLRREGRVLAAQGPFQVLEFRAQEAPKLFTEVCRLRECAFRAAGEGTGQPEDRDRYDLHYLHLVVWDEVQGRVAGAYRLAEADRVLKEKGPQGLYSHSLFRLKPELLRDLQHAVELGRSFVAPDYQGDYLPLLLLWRGIGAWIAAHPSITRLFGCVSISPDFKPLTQQLLVSFLQHNNFDARRSAWVAPRFAFKPDRGFALMLRRALQLDSMRQLQELVEEIEGGGVRVPTLLRHYLKLGGRILAFNIDPAFNHTLDGLFLVELPLSPPALLEKYMGSEAAQAYLAYHRERKVA